MPSTAKDPKGTYNLTLSRPLDPDPVTSERRHLHEHLGEDAERVADRKHNFADLKLVAVPPDRKRPGIIRLDRDDRNVRGIVGRDKRRLIFLARARPNGDVVCALDDVMVGHDEIAPLRLAHDHAASRARDDGRMA